MIGLEFLRHGTRFAARARRRARRRYLRQPEMRLRSQASLQLQETSVTGLDGTLFRVFIFRCFSTHFISAHHFPGK